MTQSTRAAVLASPRHFDLVDRPAPVAAAGEAIVRISSTAVCHTDLSIFTGDHPGVRYPVVLGHESTGIVESVGEGASGVKAGQHVIAQRGPVAALEQRTKAGGYMIGSPEEVASSIQQYEELGVDQLIYAPLTMVMDQKLVLKSVETFGKHVLPRFDKDPVHRTRRLLEAALASRAA